MQHLIKDVAGFANLTQTAGTVISQLVKSKGNLKTWIALLKYKVGTTAHTLTVMKAQGPYVTLTADAASGQAVVALSADPGTGTTAGAIAANDNVVLQQDDGSQLMTTVSSVSGLNITLATNLTAKASKGSKFWFYGLTTDGHPQYVTGTSDTETFGSDASVCGVSGSDRGGEPLIVQSNNATAAGTFVQIQGVYLDVGR